MFKKLVLGALLSTPLLSLAADVEFYVTGEIKNVPCQTSVVNDHESTVNLGIYNTALMSEQGRSTDVTKFNIALEHCPTSLNNVQFTFTGVQHSHDPDLLAINDGGAENVGIAIYEDDAKTRIPINTKSKGRSIVANSKNIMVFYANYVATGMVTGGEANATVDFSISYN